MRDLKLNSSGDLDISGYDLHLVDEKERVAQQLLIRLRFFQGEWYLDTTFGMPYYQTILLKQPDGAEVAAVFKAEIVQVADVNKILEFSIDYNNALRQLSVDFIVDTTFGPVDISEVL